MVNCVDLLTEEWWKLMNRIDESINQIDESIELLTTVMKATEKYFSTHNVAENIKNSYNKMVVGNKRALQWLMFKKLVYRECIEKRNKNEHIR